MKKLILLLIFLIPVVYSQAQFKNLGKKLEKKVKNRVERKVDRTMDKGLDKAEQGVDDATRMEKKDKGDQAGKSQANASGTGQTNDEFGSGTQNGSGTSNEFGSGSAEGNFSDSFATDRNFDFVPGNTLRLTDNFEKDNVGDFPSKWDTNGSGEVVTSGVDGSKWFLIRTGSVYIPMIGDPMTEEYTFEFDLALQGINNKTSSVAKLTLKIEDNNSYNRGRNFASVAIPLGQYGVFGTTIVKVENGQNIIRNNVQMDIRNDLLNKPHISVAVNKSRFRMWINENKIVDVPRLVPYGF